MFAHEDGGPEPDWVKTEREQFSDFRDLNKDGKMDQDEIRHWIMPEDYDHAQAEARHLVYESDQDKVRSISRRLVHISCALFLFFGLFRGFRNKNKEFSTASVRQHNLNTFEQKSFVRGNHSK